MHSEKPINIPAKILALIFGISNAVVLLSTGLAFILTNPFSDYILEQTDELFIYLTIGLYLVSLILFLIFKITKDENSLNVRMLYVLGFVLNLVYFLNIMGLIHFQPGFG